MARQHGDIATRELVGGELVGQLADEVAGRHVQRHVSCHDRAQRGRAIIALRLDVDRRGREGGVALSLDAKLCSGGQQHEIAQRDDVPDLIDATGRQRGDNRIVIAQRRRGGEVVEHAGLCHPKAVGEGVGVGVDLALLEEASGAGPEPGTLFERVDRHRRGVAGVCLDEVIGEGQAVGAPDDAVQAALVGPVDVIGVGTCRSRPCDGVDPCLRCGGCGNKGSAHRAAAGVGTIAGAVDRCAAGAHQLNGGRAGHIEHEEPTPVELSHAADALEVDLVAVFEVVRRGEGDHSRVGLRDAGDAERGVRQRGQAFLEGVAVVGGHLVLQQVAVDRPCAAAGVVAVGFAVDALQPKVVSIEGDDAIGVVVKLRHAGDARDQDFGTGG